MLKCAGAAAECMSYANRVAMACGEGYVAETRSYPERTGAAVFADSPKAKKDNLENNTLLRALS